MLRFSKRLKFAVLAVGLAAVAGGALCAANAQVDMPLHVADVQVGYVVKLLGGGPSIRRFHYFTASFVKIVDQYGQPVGGARVTGKFTDCDENHSASATTNNEVFSTGEGWAVIQGRPLECDCVHTFTVTKVTKNGCSWDPPNPLPSASECCGDCN